MTETTAIRHQIDSGLSVTGTSLVCVILTIAFWDNGGVPLRAIHLISVACIALSIIAAIKQIGFGSRTDLSERVDMPVANDRSASSQRSAPDPRSRLSDRFLMNCVVLAALSFIGYSLLQTIPTTAPSAATVDVGSVATGTTTVAEKIRSSASELARQQSVTVDRRDPVVKLRLANIAPGRLVRDLTPLICALAMLVCVPVVVDRTRLRWTLAAVVVGNATLLVLWAFIARAGGEIELLPGLPAGAGTSPFGSIVYKNAAAAAILPALVIVAAWTWHRARRQKLQTGRYIIDVATLSAITLASFLIAGVASSGSRGGLMAMLVAAAVVVIVHRDLNLSRSRRVIGSLVAMTLLPLAFVLTTANAERTGDRLGTIVDPIRTNDGRLDHFADGLRAAAHYFPFGSGLGTYRYSTLETQRSPHGSWYQHAHHRPLTLLVESGVVGLSLWIMGTVFLAMILLRRARTAVVGRSDARRESRIWTIIGLFVLVAAVAQAMVDFVIVVPVVTYLIATFMAASISTGQRSGNQNRLGVFSSVAAACLLVYCVSPIQRLRSVETVMNQTQIPTVESHRSGEIDPDEFQRNYQRVVAVLDNAIRQNPVSAELYRRRASWNQSRYRMALIAAAGQQGVTLDWDATDPAMLQQNLANLHRTEREQIAADCRSTPALVEPLTATLFDLATAIELNPYSVQSKYALLYYHPVVNLPVGELLDQAWLISRNDGGLLLEGGRIAMTCGRIDACIAHWRDHLEIDDQYFRGIAATLATALPLDQIARDVLPPWQPYWVAILLETIPSESSDRRSAAVERLVAHLQTLIQYDPAEANCPVPPTRATHQGGCYAAVGSLNDSVDQFEAASAAWKTAISYLPARSDLRWNHATSLRRGGDAEAALRAAVLGRAMSPNDARFEALITQLRHEVAQQVSSTLDQSAIQIR